jgi:hypothetical protein
MNRAKDWHAPQTWHIYLQFSATWYTYTGISPVNLSIIHIEFEVLTAVVMRSSIFWDITLYSMLKINRRFGGTCCLHLHGGRTNQVRNQLELRWQAQRWFLVRLILRPWRWRWHVPPERRLTFNGIHGVISRKTELFPPLSGLYRKRMISNRGTVRFLSRFRIYKYSYHSAHYDQFGRTWCLKPVNCRTGC